MTESATIKVFVSHCSVDKPAVRVLVDALRAPGIEPWFDEHEIGPGDDVVAKINAGLAACDVGVVVFSHNTGRWMSAELSALFYQRVEDGKVLIPVMLDPTAPVPPLLRPLLRVRIDDTARLIDAIRHRRVRTPPGTGARADAQHSVTLGLASDDGLALRVAVAIDGAPVANVAHPTLPPRLVELLREFRAGFRHAPTRSPGAAWWTR